MRELEIRRHTDDTDDDRLSPEGVRHALELGRKAVDGWALVATSGAQRATQAAACMLAGRGTEVPGGVIVVPGLRSAVEERWRSAYADVGSGHLDDLRDADAELVEQQTEVLSDALREVLDRLDDGERGLVIGHSPTNEAAVLGLTGHTIDPVDKGAGVLVTLDGDAYEVEELPGS